MPGYPTPKVRVTWGQEPSDDDKLRVNEVDLRHGRQAGLSDDQTIRRVLAIKYLSGLGSVPFVEVYRVEPVHVSPFHLAQR